MIHTDRLYKIEMLILAILAKQDCTSEELALIIQKESQEVFQIKEGVLLTSLYYFEESSLISSIKIENDTIYRIELAGNERLETLKRDYIHITTAIDSILNYHGQEVES